jgi:hypothetical protein
VYQKPSFLSVSKTVEPVEKVAATPIDDPEPGVKRPENKAFSFLAGVKKGHEGAFQQAGSFLLLQKDYCTRG